ncbi:hypothetical protein ACFLVS_00330 [Chloroflexota bacterium]
MPEKRMLIIPAELVRKIDENRGDIDRGEFIEYLIDSRLKEDGKEQKPQQQYATKDEIKEEIRSFELDIKKLLKSFVDFFVSYGLELGKQPANSEFEELTSKLHGLDDDLAPEDNKGKAKIKWK